MTHDCRAHHWLHVLASRCAGASGHTAEVRVKPRLHIVRNVERPLAPLSRAEKLAYAKAYLQRRGIYILDRGTPKPKWGVAGEPPKAAYKDGYRSLPNLLERMHESIRTLWRGQ